VTVDELPRAVHRARRPLWLDDLCAALKQSGDAEGRRRWQAYERPGSAAWELLSQIQLRFEPAQQLAPRLPVPITTGFEVMGMLGSKGSYGLLHKEAGEAGVDPVDLDLAILALGLQTVRHLRLFLQGRIGPGPSRLVFSLNLNDGMLQSPLLLTILECFFNPQLNSRIVLELIESFPKGLLGIKDPAQRRQVIWNAVDDLRRTAKTYGFQIWLDDSSSVDREVRASLLEGVVGVKADSDFVAEVFNTPRRPEDTINALAMFRVPDKPYILEGVETRRQLDLLINHWPDEMGPTGMQGWLIHVHPPFDAFFEPVNTPDFPKGYRLAPWVAEHVGPR